MSDVVKAAHHLTDSWKIQSLKFYSSIVSTVPGVTNGIKINLMGSDQLLSTSVPIEIVEKFCKDLNQLIQPAIDQLSKDLKDKAKELLND